MARKPRLIAPGDVVHARTRFVNEEFRILGDRDRQKTRELIGRAKARTDIIVLAYAIMSSHVHLLLLLGERALEEFYRSFHTALGMYLNGAPSRLGPVVAGRPWVDVVRGETIYPTLRYIHENQMQAGAAPSLRASDWTSHPVFAGIEPPHTWLDMERAASLAGYDDVAKLVDAMEDAADQGLPIAYQPANRRREELRKAAKVPVEVGTPAHHDSRIELPLVMRAEPPMRALTNHHPQAVVRAAAQACGVPPETVRARDRRHAPSSARALALFLWCTVLDNAAAVMAAHLGISESAASKLRAPESRALARAKPVLAVAIELLGDEGGDERASSRSRM